jgi:hypothetical protein
MLAPWIAVTVLWVKDRRLEGSFFPAARWLSAFDGFIAGPERADDFWPNGVPT